MVGRKRTYASKNTKVVSKKYKKRDKGDEVPSSYVTRYKFNKNANGPLPSTIKVDMIYSSYGEVNPGLATSNSVVLKANGMFDPEDAVGGHQPRGFDELMTLYDHFTVINAKITVFATNLTQTGTEQSMIVLTARDNNAVSHSHFDYMESRVMVCKPLASYGSGPNCVVLEMDLNPNAFLGRTKPLSDPELKGTLSSDPTELAYFNISVVPMRGGADIGSTCFWYRIVYTAILHEPKQPVQS